MAHLKRGAVVIHDISHSLHSVNSKCLQFCRYTCTVHIQGVCSLHMSQAVLPFTDPRARKGTEMWTTSTCLSELGMRLNDVNSFQCPAACVSYWYASLTMMMFETGKQHTLQSGQTAAGLRSRAETAHTSRTACLLGYSGLQGL